MNDGRLPGDLDSFGVVLVAPTPARLDKRGRVTTEALPARARVTGPLGGSRHYSAARLRSEAARLIRAAELLEQAVDTNDYPSLFDVEAS